ncbi:hypothetical protein HYG81_04780 [Natrinema zhouii]|uniref:Uncharacterized protein n=1 Tax=Natrinema zhouii TaxID=1710539 RepID=A0A7D6H0T8_9EURY|nr:hypothetical protein [Natrinema zhouii]QLK26925.1 hypothetical protein HYG81_04780 [Natrinema zhouii]
MPAISLFGLVAFVLQVGVGYHVYRSIAATGNGSAAIAGVIAAVAGILFLIRYGLLAALVFDFVLLLVSVLMRGRSERRPAAR